MILKYNKTNNTNFFLIYILHFFITLKFKIKFAKPTSISSEADLISRGPVGTHIHTGKAHDH